MATCWCSSAASCWSISRRASSAIKAADVKPGAEMTGDVLFGRPAATSTIWKASRCTRRPTGETRITLVSDNNFNDWERSLLLEFALPD